MDLRLNDTIVAISTPQGRGAIGIVRLSGPSALSIHSHIFNPESGKNEYPFYKMIRGVIRDGEDVIDNVLTLIAPKGKSYTGDDLVEIHAHGNPLILNEILSLVVKKGARLAEPGEFTFRAYMNGKMDLAQAESVADVIDAQSRSALNIAQKHLSGEYSKEVRDIREGLLNILVHTEASIDFSTEDIEVFSPDEIKTKLSPIKGRIEKILSSYSEGRILSEGIKIAIVGRPNVGKSSLLNALLNRERAIVTEEAGTTRDTIEESLSFKGVTCRFMDTAGIRKTQNQIEELGVKKSFEKIRSADVSLLVLDTSTDLSPEDYALLDVLKPYPHRVVLNKTDLNPVWDEALLTGKFGVDRTSHISAKERQGLEKLLESIYQHVLGEGLNAAGVYVTKIRHKISLEQALKYLKEFEKGIKEKRSFEFLAIDLRSAVGHLEQIIGKMTMEDVYDKIFSSFCIGK